MASIQIADNDALDQYTATSGQTVFDYTFVIFDADDLTVQKESGGTVTTLTRGTDYTVSGVGNASGGSITLTSGATAGDVYSLWRDMAFERTTNFATAGDFLATTVNREYNRLVLMTQQNERDIARAIRQTRADETSDMELPVKDTRAGKSLGFDSNGDVTTGPTLGNLESVVAAALNSLSLEDLAWVGDLSALQALTIPSGVTVVFMKARVTDGDGGEGLFRWDSSDLSTEVAADEVTTEQGDGGIYVAPASDKTGASGAWARLYSGDLNVRWYGATGDGSTDDRAAFAAADSAGAFVIPSGNYRISSNLTISSAVTLLSGSSVEPDSGATITFSGKVFGFDRAQHFAGSGDVAGLDWAYPEWFGATGDGSTDDTSAFVSCAVAAKAVICNRSTYIIDGTANINSGTASLKNYGFKLQDDGELYLPAGCILQQKTVSVDNYTVVGVYDVSNVIVHGKGMIKGDRDTHTGVTGEWGFCLDVRGASDVTIRDIELTDGWGDGLYFGLASAGDNARVWAININSHGNRRNNASIISCAGGGIIGGSFRDADGTAPEAGIDVEPDTGANVTDFVISGAHTRNNTQRGILCNGGSGGVLRNLLITGCSIEDEVADGIQVTTSNFVSVKGNQVNAAGQYGIYATSSSKCEIDDNEIIGAYFGIHLNSSDYSQVNNNKVFQSDRYGIYLNSSSHNGVIGNYCAENSQETTDTYSSIFLTNDSDYNNVQTNTCRNGGLTNKPKYGLQIATSNCDANVATNNDLHDSGVTGNLANAGTGTVTAAGNRV